jgi:branched-chain amino acid transport system permease protein
MRAASEDFMMARFLGVRANRVIAAAFAVSGLFAAVVSMLYVVQTGNLTYNLGVPLVLAAFVATVIGGMGSLLGAVLGGFIVGAANVFFQIVLPADLRNDRDACVFALILLILLVRPSGLVKVRSVQERV